MRKKSQGLSITTIIVAAIALIVLVVLVAIFTGRLGGFSAGVGESGTLSCNQACKAIGFTSGSSTTTDSKVDTTTTDKDGKSVKCACT